MRKIVAAEYVSLDGVMEEPGWTGPYFDGDLAEMQRELLFASDALLLGRVTYEGFASAWPSMTDEEGFADRMNTLPKHVATTTLREPLGWNATPTRDDVAEEVAKPYSQRQTEGRVNKLKLLIKRSMYGRGNFNLLLRQRMLYAAS